MGPRIHSVPGTVQQLVHLAVGQRCQREGPVQMLHVQGSPEQRGIGGVFVSGHSDMFKLVEVLFIYFILNDSSFNTFNCHMKLRLTGFS